MIIIRNESRNEVTIMYDNNSIEIPIDGYVTVETLDKLSMDSCVVRIRHGVIKIKRIAKDK